MLWANEVRRSYGRGANRSLKRCEGSLERRFGPARSTMLRRAMRAALVSLAAASASRCAVERATARRIASRRSSAAVGSTGGVALSEIAGSAFDGTGLARTGAVWRCSACRGSLRGGSGEGSGVLAGSDGAVRAGGSVQLEASPPAGSWAQLGPQVSTAPKTASRVRRPIDMDTPLIGGRTESVGDGPMVLR
jgi:hypothetical protein